MNKSLSFYKTIKNLSLFSIFISLMFINSSFLFYLSFFILTYVTLMLFIRKTYYKYKNKKSIKIKVQDFYEKYIYLNKSILEKEILSKEKVEKINNSFNSILKIRDADEIIKYISKELQDTFKYISSDKYKEEINKLDKLKIEIKYNLKIYEYYKNMKTIFF